MILALCSMESLPPHFQASISSPDRGLFSVKCSPSRKSILDTHIAFSVDFMIAIDQDLGRELKPEVVAIDDH